MTLFRQVYISLMLAVMLALLALANAMAQSGTAAFEGDLKTYQVENHAGSTYSWVIYNEPTFNVIASDVEALIVSKIDSSAIVVNWLKPGTYYLKVDEINQPGCSNTKALVVEVQEGTIPWPVVNISNPTFLVGDQEYIFSNSCQPIVIDAGKSTGNALLFNWSPSENLDNPNSSTPIFTPGTTTTYQLSVTDTYGRTVIKSIGVMVSVQVMANAGDDTFIELNNTGMLDGSKSSGENILFEWTTVSGRFVEGINTAHPLIDQPGKYYLSVTDRFGCVEKDSVMVNYYTQASKDTINVKINFSADFNVLANDIPKKNLDPASLRIVIPPQKGFAAVSADSIISYTPYQYFVGSDSFTYSISDYFQNRDEASVLVLINDDPLFIPEAFSPNGDGMNDSFEIKGIAKYKTNELVIFNRWGNIVYQSNNYGEGLNKEGFWDGNAKSGIGIGSGPVSIGTYYYILTLDGKEKLSGSIYLNR